CNRDADGRPVGRPRRPRRERVGVGTDEDRGRSDQKRERKREFHRAARKIGAATLSRERGEKSSKEWHPVSASGLVPTAKNRQALRPIISSQLSALSSQLSALSSQLFKTSL